MNIDLFNKIAQMLKQQFPKASHDLLMQQARQMYEAEMQRRSELSPLEKLQAEAQDIINF
ncbi:MAG TPA: hypothetical protein V6D18_03100 [Thermosynechococcaceae cyanobacterium]